MYNKYGGKVRLTFKLELDQLWIGTKGKLLAIVMWPWILGKSHRISTFKIQAFES